MNTLLPVVVLAGVLVQAVPIPRDDVRVGLMEVTDQASQTHAFAEILYVVDGELRWSDGDQPSTGKAGTVVLIPEGTAHSLSSPTDATGATVAFFRWAPEGDLATLHRQSTMTEPVDTRRAEPPKDRALRRYENASPDTSSDKRTRAQIDEIDWTTNWTYSEELWKVYRYKPLVRGPLAEWRGINRSDVRMGLQELEPGAAYPTHHHPSPEIYMVLSGEARWLVGNRRIDAVAGTTIYTPPETTHRIENTGAGRLRWLYFWWAPNGDISVFDNIER